MKQLDHSVTLSSWVGRHTGLTVSLETALNSLGIDRTGTICAFYENQVVDFQFSLVIISKPKDCTVPNLCNGMFIFGLDTHTTTKYNNLLDD